MAKKVKCPMCGEMNDKEDTISQSGRYFCKECFKEKELNADSYKRLIGYICRLYKIEKPTGMMLKQIKDFKNEYKFTDDGIYMTLKYYYELLDNSILEGVGLGIVPYYYEKAKKQYLMSINIEDMAESYKKDTQKTITLNIEIRDKMFDKFKKKNISFDGIDWGELDE